VASAGAPAAIVSAPPVSPRKSARLPGRDHEFSKGMRKPPHSTARADHARNCGGDASACGASGLGAGRDAG